jgi:predicted oxidoreductase
MANWNGTPKVFTLERYDSEDNWYGSSYVEVAYDWRYQTTADILTVIETSKYGTVENLYSKWDAEALLSTLAQWYSRYEGVQNLKDLLKDYLKED